MILKLKMSDDLYERYAAMATRGTARGKRTTPETLILTQLQRFSQVNPMDRPLLVGAKARQRLEGLMGGVFIGDEADLVKRVEQVADIQIQNVRVFFQPGQLTSIKRYATKNGWSFEHAIERIVQSMASQFIDHVPAS